MAAAADLSDGGCPSHRAVLGMVRASADRRPRHSQRVPDLRGRAPVIFKPMVRRARGIDAGAEPRPFPLRATGVGLFLSAIVRAGVVVVPAAVGSDRPSLVPGGCRPRPRRWVVFVHCVVAGHAVLSCRHECRAPALSETASGPRGARRRIRCAAAAADSLVLVPSGDAARHLPRLRRRHRLESGRARRALLGLLQSFVPLFLGRFGSDVGHQTRRCVPAGCCGALALRYLEYLAAELFDRAGRVARRVLLCASADCGGAAGSPAVRLRAGTSGRPVWCAHLRCRRGVAPCGAQMGPRDRCGAPDPEHSDSVRLLRPGLFRRLSGSFILSLRLLERARRGGGCHRA